jgi:hypothetical protein
MAMHHNIRIGDRVINSIDWEMTPDWTFGTFESWGGKERVRSNEERIYYFFIDNWGERPKLCLMERGVKHAKIIAEIHAPVDLVSSCVKSQGLAASYDQSFGIDDRIRSWLIDHVLDGGDSSLIAPLAEKPKHEDMGRKLPVWDGVVDHGGLTILPAASVGLTDEDVAGIITWWNFFDAELNPGGSFENRLFEHDHDTIVDAKTGLMWQKSGVDITSYRTLVRRIGELNGERLHGFDDWRLPSLAEAMSLMEPSVNHKGIHLNSNFSKEQPFIFTSAPRSPGGYWFVDYKQGRVFWSSGTIPGGFGRLCRRIHGVQ